MSVTNFGGRTRMMLDLGETWEVGAVDLQLDEKLLMIELVHQGGRVKCPECGSSCTIADHEPERDWRHLDAMQFETRLRARVPRSRCGGCGVKKIAVPWSAKHSRFTLLYEAFVIELLQVSSSIKGVAQLLGIDWQSVQRIMDRAVARGEARRESEPVARVGIDEKSFGRGQSYVSLMTDIDGHRVLEVVAGRDKKAANALWQSLDKRQRKQVEAVTIDMWRAFISSAKKHAPQAQIVHDRFHISKYLNEAVDAIRRQEHKALKKMGDDTLTGSKQLWLFNPENLNHEKSCQFDALKKLDLKTARAWAIKENFRWFWDSRNATEGEERFRKWYQWAIRCRLKPIKKVAKMLKNHLPGLLSYFQHPITNALTEGFNSRIQFLKSAARGFRNFQNYRTRILFFCGKLDLMPNLDSH